MNFVTGFVDQEKSLWLAVNVLLEAEGKEGKK